MADIGIQPSYGILDFSIPVYSDTRVSRGTIAASTVNVKDTMIQVDYRGTPVSRGTIAGSTLNVIDNRYELPYRGTPVNRGVLPATINGEPPASVDLKKLTQLWN